ncbi:M24 family metallopeptidase [Planctomonas psychrotolerans]|uniref:M24 family metallopeptidase n=1 Tax=Planctomonas psychrotolerans TaxID=2528712 RepID=UPI001239842F|nr:M24 family metallopeptidase [Planctomonas psychrotolerans]
MTTAVDAEVTVGSGEHSAKRERLLRILGEQDASALLLTSPGALAWYLCGARVHVSLAGDPIVQVLVTPEGDTVFATRNEVDRLRAEELPAGIAVRVLDWHESAGPIASELGGDRLLAEADIAAELRAARASLLPAEVDRYAALCRDAADVFSDVLPGLTPGTAERDATALVGRAVLERGADPLVLLAAGADRLGFRHPLPTPGPLGHLAMFVVCARRHGLIANVTRWVRFGAPTAEQRDAEARILEVEADYFAATRVGTTLAEILAEGAASYLRHGFAATEWENHHQGGPCGYNGRDPRATPGAKDVVVPNQAFAWNPSAPNVKVEDTVLLGPDGIQVLSTSAWPTTTVRGLPRPSVLEL